MQFDNSRIVTRTYPLKVAAFVFYTTVPLENKKGMHYCHRELYEGLKIAMAYHISIKLGNQIWQCCVAVGSYVEKSCKLPNQNCQNTQPTENIFICATFLTLFNSIVCFFVVQTYRSVTMTEDTGFVDFLFYFLELLFRMIPFHNTSGKLGKTLEEI